jgi:hypothetical protein
MSPTWTRPSSSTATRSACRSNSPRLSGPNSPRAERFWRCAAHPAGSVQLGLGTEDLAAFHAAREANGITFTQAPTPMHGAGIARFLDSEGAETSIGG